MLAEFLFAFLDHFLILLDLVGQGPWISCLGIDLELSSTRLVLERLVDALQVAGALGGGWLDLNPTLVLLCQQEVGHLELQLAQYFDVFREYILVLLHLIETSLVKTRLAISTIVVVGALRIC